MILDGKKVAGVITEALKSKVADLGMRPVMKVIQVGTIFESTTFIERKKKYGKDIGVEVEHDILPESITESELLSLVRANSANPHINALIVQLPLPPHICTEHIMDAIAPEKDADGLSSYNVAALLRRSHNHVEAITAPGAAVPFTLSATARGILALLDAYHITLKGKHVVVVGRSNLVGKPIALSCLSRNATVTVCHSHSNNLASYTKSADILITATGKAGLISAEHVREGQIIIDVGITSDKGRLCGDVMRGEVEPIVEAISPVPGGVGPLTVACLFANCVDLTEFALKR